MRREMSEVVHNLSCAFSFASAMRRSGKLHIVICVNMPSVGASQEHKDAWSYFSQRVTLCNSVPRSDAERRVMSSALMNAVLLSRDKVLKSRKRTQRDSLEPDITNKGLSKIARFTDSLPLKVYERTIQQVPRLVNVVTLAETIPLPGFFE